MILITGGLGFIGTNFINFWLNSENEDVINIDNLSCVSNLSFINNFSKNRKYKFFKGDICDKKFINYIINKYKPRAIIHFAAETHVDNSIFNPEIFISTNIVGTYNLVETFKTYIEKVDMLNQEVFLRFSWMG